MFCSKCGTQVDEKAQFCQKCGTAVGAVSDNPASSAAAKPKGGGRTKTLAGWVCVLLALGCIFIPVPKEVTSILAFLLSWVGFSLVFPGGSAIVKAGKGAVGAVIVAVFVGYIGDLVSGNSQKPAVDALKVNIDTLLADYGTNEVGADQKYKGHVIETTGVLQAIKKDIADAPFVLLSSGGDLAVPSFQCALSSAGARQAASMSPGQRVVVQGKVAGLMLNVQAQDCIFVTTPAPAPAAGAKATGATAPLPTAANPAVVPTDATPQATQTATPTTPTESKANWVEAECRITQGGQTLTPPCEVMTYPGGTFSIEGIGGAEVLEGIIMISVAGDDSGYEVRGLTKEGMNSLWGDATHDAGDPSCFVGSDFRVCARPKGR